MVRAIAFSLPAAHRFEAGLGLSYDWADSLNFGGSDDRVATVKLDDVSYVFRADETTSNGLIVVRIEPGKLFSCFVTEDGKLEALQRCIKAGIFALEGGGQLPDYWRPFSRGNYITFHAQSFAKSDQRRLVMLRKGAAPDGYAFIFDVTTSQRDYDALNPDLLFIENVLNKRNAALASLPKRTIIGPQIGPVTHELERLPEQVDTVVQGWKLPYLYESKLTKRQKDFVDVELDRSVRLKGAAGTGKTLAMIAKMLREATTRKNVAGSYRFLFLTHNASAAELAEEYAMALDADDLIYVSDNEHTIEINTLLNLAVGALSEDLVDLQPISSDAHEGKKLQLIVLSDTVKIFRSGAYVTFKLAISKNVADGIEARPDTPEHEEFCWDVMNEIACVLDADGVRDNQTKREAYLKDNKRPQYLMRLETLRDREVILAIYDLYRAALRKEGLMSVDQIIADYLGYLDSFRWDARRTRLGYDAVFVDEYHLFNRIERAAFPSLLRDRNLRPVIIIALDPRQSPKAVFLDAAFGAIDSTVPLAAGQAKQLRDFEFVDIFRYTPEIAAFLSFVNHAFPETDLSEEWLPGLATSALASGMQPIAHEHVDQTSQYDAIIEEGLRRLKDGKKGSTAVITLSRKSFDVISRAGRYDKKIYVVDSRESLNRLQYVGGRIVFSMPEYVAGVQFDNVLIADVNERDDIGRPTSLARSRFGSNLYLAASRARKIVSLYANRQFGGLAPVVMHSIEQGIVVRG